MDYVGTNVLMPHRLIIVASTGDLSPNSHLHEGGGRDHSDHSNCIWGITKGNACDRCDLETSKCAGHVDNVPVENAQTMQRKEELPALPYAFRRDKD